MNAAMLYAYGMDIDEEGSRIQREEMVANGEGIWRSGCVFLAWGGRETMAFLLPVSKEQGPQYPIAGKRAQRIKATSLIPPTSTTVSPPILPSFLLVVYSSLLGDLNSADFR